MSSRLSGTAHPVVDEQALNLAADEIIKLARAHARTRPSAAADRQRAELRRSVQATFESELRTSLRRDVLLASDPTADGSLDPRELRRALSVDALHRLDKTELSDVLGEYPGARGASKADLVESAANMLDWDSGQIAAIVGTRPSIEESGRSRTTRWLRTKPDSPSPADVELTRVRDRYVQLGRTTWVRVHELSTKGPEAFLKADVSSYRAVVLERTPRELAPVLSGRRQVRVRIDRAARIMRLDGATATHAQLVDRLLAGLGSNSAYERPTDPPANAGRLPSAGEALEQLAEVQGTMGELKGLELMSLQFNTDAGSTVTTVDLATMPSDRRRLGAEGASARVQRLLEDPATTVTRFTLNTVLPVSSGAATCSFDVSVTPSSLILRTKASLEAVGRVHEQIAGVLDTQLVGRPSKRG